MLDSFLTFINQQQWDLSNQRTLLAVSGGVDSVVMLHLFHRAGLNAEIAHCNFGLRGEESDQDEEFVRSLSEKYGFALHVKRFDTKSYAQSNSVSTQMAARDLRYTWFAKLANKHFCNWIATAHHANDSIETTLLNFTRGTGLAGLHGISVTTGNVIRPLLFADRMEIENYLHENGLVWREDRSNASVDYKRNLIRHKLIPLLKQMNPGLERTFKTSSERLRAADNLLDGFMSDWGKQVTVQQGSELLLDISKIMATAEPAYSLWFLLQKFGFGYRQAQQIVQVADSHSGKIFQSDRYELLKDREFFLVRSRNEQQIPAIAEIGADDESCSLGELSLSLDRLDLSEDLSFSKEKGVVYLDQKSLAFPLTVRNWESGDVFCPFGMGGRRKKVSDLLIDAKVPLFEKRETKVLVNGDGKIIWVVGIRADDRFRVADTRKNILKITLVR